MTRLSLLLGAAVLAVSLTPVGSANAASCASGNSATAATPALDTSDVTIEFGGMTVESSACAGLFDGNDIGGAGEQLIDLLNGGLFASYTDAWSIFGKSDDVGSGVTAPDATTGTFSIDFTPLDVSVFTVSLKASTFFAVYLFDLSPLSTMMVGGDFKTFGRINNGGQTVTANLSHLGVATFDSGNSTVFPLPAAGWLLLTGLAGLGFAARRRKAA